MRYNEIYIFNQLICQRIFGLLIMAIYFCLYITFRDPFIISTILLKMTDEGLELLGVK